MSSLRPVTLRALTVQQTDKTKRKGKTPQSTTLVPSYILCWGWGKPSGLTQSWSQSCREFHIHADFKLVFSHSWKKKRKSWWQNWCSSFAHLLLDLTEDLLLQFGGVVLLQHVVLPPRLCPLLGVLHLLWGQGQVKADALDVELGSLPAFGPWLWAHLYLHLVNRQKFSII